MLTRKAFVSIVESADKYWKTFEPHLQALGIYESGFHTFLDTVIEAIDLEIDPAHRARTDELTYDCGSYVIEWLYGADNNKLRQTCPTAGALYDYIMQS